MSTQTKRSEETVASGQSPVTGVIEAVSVKQVLLAYFLLAATYIYLPTFSVIAFSFNSGGLTFPFVKFTFKQYGGLLVSEGLIEAVRRSVTLALIVTVITTVLTTTTALAYRYDFWGQRGLLSLLILGIITPGITYGVSATLLLNKVLGLTRNLWPAVPIHVAWALPFVVIILLAGFLPAFKESKEAACVLGVGPLSQLRSMIPPQIAPALLGAAVLAFTLSYNKATRSLLLVGNQNMMSLGIFAITAGTRAQSYLFALGSLTIVLSTLLLTATGLLVIYNHRF